jgi:hypothetical protein
MEVIKETVEKYCGANCNSLKLTYFEDLLPSKTNHFIIIMMSVAMWERTIRLTKDKLAPEIRSQLKISVESAGVLFRTFQGLMESFMVKGQSNL